MFLSDLFRTKAIKMQHDNSMSERILRELENIVNNDEYLKEFSIVPTEENVKNKSPVLYVDHNVGLESWCIKHVYNYAYLDLFKVRKLLQKGRIPVHKMENLNHLLIGALLINPDVSTFWNMKRELVEHNMLNVRKELQFTKFVLSHKSKSNETFAYRRWLLNRQLSKINDDDVLTSLVILTEELAVTEMAANKASNNYHAWTHRMWSVNNLAPRDRSAFEFSELEFSLKWIFLHVSQHAGFHYRQFIHKCMKANKNASVNEDLHLFLKNFLSISNLSYNNILTDLMGKQDLCHKVNNDINSINYIAALLFDLCCMLNKLTVTFPGHETFWCHRKYLVYHLVQFMYEYHGINFKVSTQLDDSNVIGNKNANIVRAEDAKNDETQAKLLKYEPNKIESSYLYKLIAKNEKKFINDHICQESDGEHAKRYEKWLINVLGFHGI